MGKIYVIGLGPGSEDCLTLGAIKRIHGGKKHFLRTEQHPTVQYFKDNDIEYKSYDYIYDSKDEFIDVYQSIVNELKKEASSEEEINYYIPGNPFVAEKTVELLINEKNLDIEIISGMSFIEPMIEIVKRDPINGLKLIDGSVIDYLDIDINSDTIITQVYNQRILADVKIVLSEIYGDDHLVWLIHNGGIKGKEEILYVPIYELDKNMEVGHLSSIFVPKIGKNSKKVFDFSDIMDIMRILRGEDGCPWDKQQDHNSIRQSLLEEAYEVVDAIDSQDIDSIVEELGDLLYQIVFHTQIGYEEGEFTLIDITTALANKLILRHPHVFKEKSMVNSDEVVYNWNEIKYESRNITTLSGKLRDIPRLPALMSSFKVQDKAAAIGFDWDDINGPIDKIKEEFEETIEAMNQYGVGSERVEEELGDLLFAVVNFSRFLKVNPEVALNRTINKFITRLEQMEIIATQKNNSLDNMTLEEMDILWNEVKKFE